jgi:hypothetical protein
LSNNYKRTNLRLATSTCPVARIETRIGARAGMQAGSVVTACVRERQPSRAERSLAPQRTRAG